MSVATREVSLYSAAAIARRIDVVAGVLASARKKPDIAVPVLSGAFVFAADLLRALARRRLDLEIEFIWLRSYGRFERPGQVSVLKGPSEIVRGRRVLLIDGVLESGGTLARAKELLSDAGAKSIVSVVAVRKPYLCRLADADHVLFEAGPEFLYGYGMDRVGRSRGLPDIRAKAAARPTGKKKART